MAVAIPWLVEGTIVLGFVSEECQLAIALVARSTCVVLDFRYC